MLPRTGHEKGLRSGVAGVQAQRKSPRESDGPGGADAGGTALRSSNRESLHDKLNDKEKKDFFTLHGPPGCGYGFVCYYIAQKIMTDTVVFNIIFIVVCFLKPILLKIQMCYLCNLKKMIFMIFFWIQLSC